MYTWEGNSTHREVYIPFERGKLIEQEVVFCNRRITGRGNFFLGGGQGRMDEII